ncbi:MAG: hypothetical protein WCL39_08500, partial [Armatimonadota bacterium]
MDMRFYVSRFLDNSTAVGITADDGGYNLYSIHCPNWSKTANSVRVKRVHSIAQNLDHKVPGGPHIYSPAYAQGYSLTGSYAQGAGWNSGNIILTNGSQSRWGKTLSDNVDDGKFPFNSIVSYTPPSNPFTQFPYEAETDINIHL